MYEKIWNYCASHPGYRFVDSQGKTQVQPSQWRDGRFDQPVESLIWLNTFRSMNENFLLQVL